MAGTCLRRRKDMVFGGKSIVELPEIKEFLHKIGMNPWNPWKHCVCCISLDARVTLDRYEVRGVGSRDFADLDFTREERKKYALLEKEAKGLLEKVNRGDQKNFYFVLELLLRMRQFSVYPHPLFIITFPTLS